MTSQPVIPLDALKYQNLFSVEPIYIGDADEGTEGIAGHTRMYKYDGQIYVTEDDNLDRNENIIAVMTADFFNNHFIN